MQFLRVTPDTTKNSNLWKLWHGVNIFIAGWCFLIGSLVMFPRFTNEIYAQLCGWMFTVGSVCFFLADFTELLYFITEDDYRYLSYAINFFINVFGSGLYLIGSIFFIPNVMNFYAGVHSFVAGALLVMIAQTWKLWRSFHNPEKTTCQILKQETMTVVLDFLAAFGAFMYFAGSLVYQQSVTIKQCISIGAAMYCIGATANCVSSVMVFIRYFIMKHSQGLLQNHEKQTNTERISEKN